MKKLLYHMTSILLLVGAYGCALSAPPPAIFDKAPGIGYIVSLIELIANSPSYHGVEIRTIGFLSTEFEGTAVYLHKEDYERGLTKNAVRLDVKGFQGAEKYDEKYVLIQGTFEATPKSHPDIYSGTIRSIKVIQVWESRAELFLRFKQ